ncbi:uncharacterized protein TNCV_1391281 [Trichonephila clavipes]|nr:uncharacterized protein TNCV_1391281 [Trichonephila clavipes]
MYSAFAACGTLNSRRAASPLVWFVEDVERWEALTTPDVLPQNWVGNEPNRTVTCMVLKAMTNDRRHLALCHDAFRGPRSGFADQVALVTTITLSKQLPTLLITRQVDNLDSLCVLRAELGTRCFVSYNVAYRLR